jgi:predicted transcriptional regulator
VWKGLTVAKETKSVRENDALVLDCATEVMCAYLSKNPLAVSDLPSVIKSVHAVIRGLHEGHAGLPGALNKLPVPIKKSIGEDFLICFEDGLKFKSLKRHLRARYSMSPEEYRAKWGLPADYPMVAPGYAKKRSQLAKEMGLGRRDRTGDPQTSTNA